MAKKSLYFCYFSGGPDPLSPSGSAHESAPLLFKYKKQSEFLAKRPK